MMVVTPELAILVFGIFIKVLWMVIGWRAMRAHEKLADSVEWLARQSNNKQEPQSDSLGDD